MSAQLSLHEIPGPGLRLRRQVAEQVTASATVE